MRHPICHMLATAILSTTRLLTPDHPAFFGRRTTGEPQGHHVTDEQCIHTPAYMIIHCRGNSKTVIHNRSTRNTLLRTFPYGCKLNMVIYSFYYGVDWRVQRDVKNTQLGRAYMKAYGKTLD